jgi:hypothetical protein
MRRRLTTTPGLETEQAELGLVDRSIQVSSNWYSISFEA